jgi:hypothetical protein
MDFKLIMHLTYARTLLFDAKLLRQTTHSQTHCTLLIDFTTTLLELNLKLLT